MLTALDQLEARTWRRFAPPPRITLSEWADRERVLPPESSAEPGRWRTARVPYLREPMDVIADRHVETVVVMASSQVGKTELLLNLVGYHMHRDPCPMMLLEPTIEIAGAISKDRIMPMLRDTPALRGLVGTARARCLEHDAAQSVSWRRVDLGGRELSRQSRVAADPRPARRRVGPLAAVGRRRRRSAVARA